MASITFGEMADCDWQKRNFSGPLFSRHGPGCPLRKKRTHEFKKNSKTNRTFENYNLVGY
jgi:hypothetical protein